MSMTPVESPQTPASPDGDGTPVAPGAVQPVRRGFWQAIENQLALGPLLREYFIPVETNNLWYALGGVLAISLVLEVLTGIILSLEYVPDASRAYDITSQFLQSTGWSIILNFHFFTAILIFLLVMVHMVRVFISGGYRRGKQALWLVGTALAGFTFLISLTGEALHFDEVGFGVPWNIGEVLNALGLADAFNYTTDALKQIPVATEKLGQLYAVHISIVPVLLILFIGLHYYLVKVKGISKPFWLRASGRTASFTSHIRVWMIYAGILLGAMLLISIFVHRDAGTSPQLLQSSPLYGTEDDPGGLGFRPNFPISWTRGMNIIVASVGMDPDIWGTVIGMLVLLGALVAVPYVDRGDSEPAGWLATFNWRKRGWAFIAMALFWVVLLSGLIRSALTGAG